MAWDFTTEPEFEAKLEWIRHFVRDRIEPLDLLHGGRAYHPLTDELRPLVDPLKQAVRSQGLWAAHLGPELGGKGFGQLKLGLINEILGRSSWAPIIFGTQAPDTGNAEILAHYGTDEQQARYLQPLLEGEVFSSFSMTEPHAGSDPKLFTTRARRDGDEWVLDGWKFFSSNARTSSFLIVMAVSNPDVSPYKGMSMFLVPTETPGVDIERHIGLMGEADGTGMHALIHYDGVRLPADALLGGEGQAFAIAQTRLGGGRVHHAMRTVGNCQWALDMMCERALSRETQGSLLADKQLVQAAIAESYAQLAQFRLLVLHTAWQIDQHQDYRRVRKDIAAIKFLTPQVLHDIVYRSMHIHGALGVSNELPFASLWHQVAIMAVVDGPTEVHKITVAREVLKDYQPAPGLWPTEHLPPSASRPSEARGVPGTRGGQLLTLTGSRDLGRVWPGQSPENGLRRWRRPP
ncbi:MAG: acyl-CoA dehydrogenase family protein [Acidimicrobiales bacterium]